MTIISIVSIIGVTVGVAALVVILSVFNGFSGLVTSILVNFDPHLRIESNQPQPASNYERMLTDLNQKDYIRGASMFVQSKAMIIGKGGNRVVNIKGMDERIVGDVSGIKEKIVLGSFTFQADGEDGIVLGMTLADRLGALVGDRLSIISPASFETALMQVGQPIIRRFRVTGIYESNNKDYDVFYAFVSITAGQKLFLLGDRVHGVELRLSDFHLSDYVKQQLAMQYGTDYHVQTWFDIHKELYTVMQIEHWMAYIILGMIIGIASFNLLGLLTMSVIEKTRDIGILRSIGAKETMILKIYISQGILVGVIGTLCGVLLGIFLVYLQSTFHLFPLDPTVYIIPAIPVEVKIGDILAISILSIILCSLAAIYPAKRASKLIPVEAIRWE